MCKQQQEKESVSIIHLQNLFGWVDDMYHLGGCRYQRQQVQYAAKGNENQANPTANHNSGNHAQNKV